MKRNWDMIFNCGVLEYYNWCKVTNLWKFYYKQGLPYHFMWKKFLVFACLNDHPLVWILFNSENSDIVLAQVIAKPIYKHDVHSQKRPTMTQEKRFELNFNLNKTVSRKYSIIIFD